MYWFGATSIVLSVGAGLFFHYGYDGIFDWFAFISHMVVWPQNFFFWLIMLLNNTENNRKLYYFSSFTSAIGPYVLNHVYAAWIILDAIF